MRLAALAGALALAACAAPAAGPPGVGEGYEPSTIPTSQTPYPPVGQVMVIPPARTVPLAPRDPPAIVQSRLERMAMADVARWALPEHAARVVRVEFMKVWMPVIRYGGFYERPAATGAPGVCQVFVHGVNFRPYRESELIYPQHLDPPLEPYQVTDAFKYKVLGSTLTGAAATPAACEAALPYGDWFEAPSDQAVYLAINAVQRAAAWPGQYAITCRDERLRPDGQTFETYACDGPALLETLTPNLIRRVQGLACEPAFASETNPCFEVTFDDPKAPGTHSQYVVKTGARRLAIQHVLMPPM